MVPPGIDLVYLPDALSRRRSDHVRYREIVFHSSELRMIDVSENPELLVHIFWAAKEAVYKSWRQQHAQPKRFVPHQVTVREMMQQENQFHLIAEMQGNRFPVIVNRENDYVLAVCGTVSQFRVIEVPGHNKAQVRHQLQDIAAAWSKVFAEQLFLTYSHDGPYAAVAMHSA